MKIYTVVLFVITFIPVPLVHAIGDSLTMESSLVVDPIVKPGEIVFKVSVTNNSDQNLCLVGWPKTAVNGYLLDGLDGERYVIDPIEGATFLRAQTKSFLKEDFRPLILPPSKKMSYVEDISKTYGLKDGQYSVIFYTLYFECSLLSDPSLDVSLISDRTTGDIRYAFYTGRGMDWVVTGERHNTILSRSTIATSTTKISLPLKYDKIYDLKCDSEQKEHLKPSGQFKINGDEVFDTATELTWKRCYVGQSLSEGKCIGEPVDLEFTQNKFINNENSVVSDDNRWRVPTINELKSIVDYVCLKPGLNKEVFPIAIEDYGLETASSNSVDSEGNPYYMQFTSGRALVRTLPSFGPVLLVKGKGLVNSTDPK